MQLELRIRTFIARLGSSAGPFTADAAKAYLEGLMCKTDGSMFAPLVGDGSGQQLPEIRQ